MQDIMRLSNTIVPEETDQFLAHFRHACVTHLMNIRLLATTVSFLCLIHTYYKCKKLLDLITYEYSFDNWFCLCDRSSLRITILKFKQVNFVNAVLKEISLKNLTL